jgi:hypothetical protein
MFPVGHRLILRDESTRADAPSASSVVAARGEGPGVGRKRHKSDHPHQPAESATPGREPDGPAANESHQDEPPQQAG